jgi:hypothetical protein
MINELFIVTFKTSPSTRSIHEQYIHRLATFVWFLCGVVALKACAGDELEARLLSMKGL